MAVNLQRLDRLELDLLRYHMPKMSLGMGGAMQLEIKTVMLTEVVRDLDLRGREAMIQRAYSKFCAAGLMTRAGFGYKLTEKGVEAINELKKLGSL